MKFCFLFFKLNNVKGFYRTSVIVLHKRNTTFVVFGVTSYLKKQQTKQTKQKQNNNKQKTTN